VSVENRYMVLVSRDHAVGLTFYLERASPQGSELEAKIILGQSYHDWRDSEPNTRDRMAGRSCGVSKAK